MNKVQEIGVFSASLIVSVAEYMPGANGYRIDLNGPTNDANRILDQLAVDIKAGGKKGLGKLFRSLFKSNRRKAKNLHNRLKDETATKKNIAEYLATFAASIEVGKIGLFTFSGHGTQITDTTGLESDGLVECLCPYDTLAGQLLTDDEVRHIINTNLKEGAKILMVLDCCHSGGQARGIAKARGISASLMDKQISKNFNFDDKLPEGVVVLAACKDNEVAWEREYEGRPHGALTFHISPYIALAAQGKPFPLKEMHMDLLEKMYDPNVLNDQGSQTPCLEAKGGFETFSNFWNV